MANLLRVAWAAYATEKSAPKRPHFSRDERDFLPAALEIVETPPSPAARWTAFLLTGLFVAALAWSYVGRIDVVAIAEGRIVPSGRVKVIQPLEAGVIRTIHVRDGTAVRRGQVLVELDATSAGAERERLANELAAAEVTAARLRALLSAQSVAELEQMFSPPDGTPADMISTQRRLMVGQWNESAARLGVLRDDVARRRGEHAGIAAAIAGLNRSIPVLRERYQIRDQLARTGNGSRIALLEDTQRLVAEERELAVQRERLTEVSAAISLAENQVRQYQAEVHRTQLAELNDAEQKIAGLRQELIRAELRQRLQTLDAPIDGTVQQLAVHTVGGVVTPAQQLMVIVPADDTLEVEAALQNRDIGFVQAGQETEIKLETFLFTRYGTIRGRVVSVSGDAIVDPNQTTPQGQRQDQSQSPVYMVRVRLDRSTMGVDGRVVHLAPGMRATVEVKTDQRRVLDYLLSPIMRYRQESLRER